MARIKSYKYVACLSVFLLNLIYIFPGESFSADGNAWIGMTNNEWNDPINWSNNSIPESGDWININGGFAYTPVLTTSNYTPSGGSIGTLTIDGGMFIHNNGYLPVSSETIGLNGYGTYFQYGGTNNVSTMQIGANLGSVGAYNMYNGNLTSDIVHVGAYGTGTFTQYGGTNQATNLISIGHYSGSSGTYLLENGTLSANETIMLGWAGGSGTLKQYGGTVNVARIIQLGGFFGGTGVYDIYNGNIETTYLTSGRIGSGIFNQWNGDINVTNKLFVGEYNGSVGAYNMYNGNLTSSQASIGANLSTGTFNQYGGINISGNISIGTQGIYNLHGGTLLANINNDGVFNAIGDYGGGGYGANNITNNGNWNIGTKDISWNVNLNNFVNNGTLKVTNSTVYYEGNFINNGAYISDPSTNIFNNLTIGSSGYLTGALGDVFKINGNLIVSSLNNSQWNTSGALLEFSSGIHTLDLSGSTVNFHWGTLQIDDGGYFSNISNGDILADVLRIYDFMGFLTEFQGNGIHINYASLFAFDADGSSYILTGEQLTQLASLGINHAPVPEPSTMLLLGSGLVGLVGYGRRRLKK